MGMEVSRRHARSSIATVAGIAVAILMSGPALADRVQGAGSTFAFPIISAWAKSFLQDRADGTDFVVDETGVDYEPVGSLGGVLRLSQPEMDFAASDAPFPPEELSKRGLAQFPIVIGGIAAVVNLDGVKPGQLKLSGDVLAKAYLGTIKNWNDPAIAQLNPEIALPDQPITVVNRADGSGSTQTWTQYLAASNTEWRDRFGSNTIIVWPTGQSVEGSAAMLEAVTKTKGAIGYVEYGQAARAGLAYAQLSNGTGAFVAPSPENFAATALAAEWDPARDFHLKLTDTKAAGAYPLAAATFILMHKTDRSGARTRRALFFFSFALEKGDAEAAALGYVPLPAELVTKVKDYWRTSLPGAAGF
jgi:phosphate transport system substrate-binding protein